MSNFKTIITIQNKPLYNTVGAKMQTNRMYGFGGIVQYSRAQARNSRLRIAPDMLGNSASNVTKIYCGLKFTGHHARVDTRSSL